MKLLVATTNAGKTREIGAILDEYGLGGIQGPDVEIVGLEALPGVVEVEETGSTFEENALIKARYYHSISGYRTLADDSGIEVDALDRRPGVLSARYAGPAATDRDRVNKLLDELKLVPEERRSARFVCAAAFVGPEGEHIFTASAPGRVLTAPRGSGGFGYDPVFYYEPLGKTFAELSDAEKARVSHRGLAFAELARWLKGQLG